MALISRARKRTDPGLQTAYLPRGLRAVVTRTLSSRRGSGTEAPIMAEEVMEHDLPSPGARRVPTPSDSLSFCLSLLFFSLVPSRPHAVGVRQCDVVRKHWRGPD